MLFQFLPRLSDDEYAALEASIREHGVQVPVILDEHGSVIDGHHRKEIADRLGIEYPKRTKVGLSDALKRTLAITLNVDRRHLDRAQKRALVAASVTADPEMSDREHAKRTSVDHKTVGAIREQMVSRGEIPHVPERIDSLGRQQPASKSAPRPVSSGYDADQLNAETESKALGRALMTLTGMKYPAHRNRIITQWWPLGNEAVPPDSRALFEPEAIREIASWLMQLADDLEVAP